jgi:hypothetical protein
MHPSRRSFDKELFSVKIHFPKKLLLVKLFGRTWSLRYVDNYFEISVSIQILGAHIALLQEKKLRPFLVTFFYFFGALKSHYSK